MYNRMKYLLEQYKNANGIKEIDSNSKFFLEDFTIFLKDMKQRSYGYTDFLKHNRFNFIDVDTAEIGKGRYDTVVEQFNTTLITTDRKEELTNIEEKRIIEGELLVFENEPFVHKSVSKSESIMPVPKYIRTFMTQNPYTYKDISGFAALHNNDYNIILGVYGNINDYDRLKKIESLKKIKDLISSNYKDDYEVDNDSYYYVIGSILKTVKIRERIKNYVNDFNSGFERSYVKKR